MSSLDYGIKCATEFHVFVQEYAGKDPSILRMRCPGPCNRLIPVGCHCKFSTIEAARAHAAVLQGLMSAPLDESEDNLLEDFMETVWKSEALKNEMTTLLALLHDCDLALYLPEAYASADDAKEYGAFLCQLGEAFAGSLDDIVQLLKSNKWAKLWLSMALQYASYGRQNVEKGSALPDRCREKASGVTSRTWAFALSKYGSLSSRLQHVPHSVETMAHKIAAPYAAIGSARGLRLLFVPPPGISLDEHSRLSVDYTPNGMGAAAATLTLWSPEEELLDEVEQILLRRMPHLAVLHKKKQDFVNAWPPRRRAELLRQPAVWRRLCYAMLQSPESLPSKVASILRSIGAIAPEFVANDEASARIQILRAHLKLDASYGFPQCSTALQHFVSKPWQAVAIFLKVLAARKSRERVAEIEELKKKAPAAGTPARQPTAAFPSAPSSGSSGTTTLSLQSTRAERSAPPSPEGDLVVAVAARRAPGRQPLPPKNLFPGLNTDGRSANMSNSASALHPPPARPALKDDSSHIFASSLARNGIYVSPALAHHPSTSAVPLASVSNASSARSAPPPSAYGPSLAGEGDALLSTAKEVQEGAALLRSVMYDAEKLYGLSVEEASLLFCVTTPDIATEKQQLLEEGKDAAARRSVTEAAKFIKDVRKSKKF